MLMTGLREWYLAVKQDHKFHILRIDYNEENAEALLERCIHFWLNNVVEGIEPDVDASDSTTETLGRMYPDSVQGDMTDLSEVSKQIEAIEECKAQKKNIDMLQNGLINIVKAVLGENESGFTDKYLVSWKTAKNGTRTFRIKAINRKGDN